MRFPLLIALLICALGIVSLTQMPRDIDPPDVVVAETILSYLPGTAPDKLDRLVTRPVERVLSSVPDIVDVGTQTTDGISIVNFQLSSKANREETLSIVRDRLSQLRSAIQLETPLLIGPSLQIDSGNVYSGLLLATEASPEEKPDFEKVRRAAAIVVEKLRADPAITSAEVTHDQPRAVVIRYSDESLADAGLTPPELAEFIRANSQQFPGGYLAGKKGLFAIDIDRGISDVESLRDLPVRDPRDGSLTPLSEVAEISVEPWDASLGGVFLGEQRALGITFTKSESATWDELDAAVDAISLTESDISIDRFFYRGETTDELIRSSSWTVFFSIIAVLICVTLGLGVRAGFATSIAVATTLLGAIFLLHLFGFGLNVVTLAALAVGIGLLIDNHIVITHHVGWLRRTQHSKTRSLDVRAKCWQDLAGPLVIAAATTALGFLPAWLLRGEPAGYVSSLFIVITILLVVSQIVGFTITPLMAPASAMSGGFLNSLSGKFEASSMKRIGKPRRVLVFLGLFLAGSILCFFFAVQQPMATIPTRHLSVDLELPSGTTPETTAATAATVREKLESEFAYPVATFLNMVPPAIYRGSHTEIPSASFARLVVSFPPGDKIPDTITASISEILPEGTGLRVRPITATPSNPQPIAIRLSGSAETLADLVEKDPKLFSRVKEAQQVTEISIAPDLEMAAEQKFTTSEIALGALAVTGGIPVTLLADETDPANRQPVLLKVASDNPRAEDRLSEAYVHRQSGGDPIPLEDLAEITKREVPLVISRWNGANVGYLYQDPVANSIAEEQELMGNIRAIEAENFSAEAIGDFAQADETEAKIFRYLIPVAIGILLLLLIQARSFRGGFAILLAIIPALFGAALSIWLLTGFGVMQLLGVIAVTGIIVNNAIVLIDRLRCEKAVNDAEIAAVARSRFVPILLSALCAILGLLPLLISGNPLWVPFATVMIGGLAFGGFSVLAFLPAVWKTLNS